MTIIHVDDDDFILEAYGQALSNKGHDYHAINNPQLAVDAIQRIKPEIIILDVTMPSLNGIDLIEEIKQVNEIAEIPVIFLTNMPYELCGEKAKERGAAGYFSKRWQTPELLVDTIQQIFSKK